MPEIAAPQPARQRMEFGTKAERTYRYALVEILQGTHATPLALCQIAQKALNKHGGKQYKEPVSD